MQTSNLTPSNLALDEVIPTITEAVPPSTMSAITVTTLGISLPCAGNPALTDVQQTPLTSTDIPEKGPTGFAAKEGWAGHPVEEDKQTAALPAAHYTQVPATVPHRTTTREDPHEEEDTALLHTGIRSATLCFLILVVMKVNYILIGHLMAKDPFILHFNWSLNRAVDLSW